MVKTGCSTRMGANGLSLCREVGVFLNSTHWELKEWVCGAMGGLGSSSAQQFSFIEADHELGPWRIISRKVYFHESDTGFHCMNVTLCYFKIFASLLQKLSFAFFDTSEVEYPFIEFTGCSFFFGGLPVSVLSSFLSLIVKTTLC